MISKATSHWIQQRLTAALLIPLTFWLLVSVASLSNAHYTVVHNWLSTPRTTLLLALFLLVAGHHAYLGLRVVVEDYLAESRHHLVIQALRIFLLLIITLSIGSLLVISQGGG